MIACLLVFRGPWLRRKQCFSLSVKVKKVAERQTLNAAEDGGDEGAVVGVRGVVLEKCTITDYPRCDGWTGSGRGADPGGAERGTLGTPAQGSGIVIKRQIKSIKKIDDYNFDSSDH